jgi:hypothetical protein
MDIIKIDPNEIVELEAESGQLVMKPSAEKSLMRLLELKQMVDDALERAKAMIVQSATALNPDFRGLEGEEIRIIFRSYGEKYEYDWTKKDSLKPFLTEKIYYKVDSKKVDEYLEKVGELPEGIKEKERSKTPSIKFIGDKDED